ncbi:MULTISPECIES: hypothetical protein [Cytobacillus]|uniref:Uncharacterized protein n=1 Tax=Cytobacillus kochii TaxID=859143 RepID=A0A248TPL4_9BACI|nr:hypothetical protein [Cytobacillus kochii]ASV70163.1 hypothetical protein CKF48_23020 [Cytobacillus kochii]MDQ0186735.1 hypothetical protein [Cytobacillus kochii]
MGRTEKIPFKEFMKGNKEMVIAGDSGNSVRHLNKNMYLSMSPLLFFDGGTLLIVASGVLGVSFALLENKALREDDYEKGEKISLIGHSLFLITGIVLAVYFLVLKNPLLKFL